MEVELPQGCPNFEAWRAATPVFWGEPWKAIKERLREEREPCNPAPENVFRALCLTPPDAVSVVILAMDPYPHKPRGKETLKATGLAFSFPSGKKPTGSLKNILKKLTEDIGERRANGDLESWAREGILLLNVALTVRKGKSGSHLEKGWCPDHPWQSLAEEILKKLYDDSPDTLFVFWGGKAIDVGIAALPAKVFHNANQPGSRIIVSSHPSNQGRDKKVNRTIAGIDKQFGSFSDSHPFRQINQWRRERLPAIIWGDPAPAADARAPEPPPQ